jgi:ABC-type amino acid transport system permease subunit
MSNKSWLQLAFEALPFHDSLEKMWQFVRKPEIEGGSLKDSLLRYSGQNFIASLFLVSTVVALVQYLLPQLFEINIGQLINPLYLTLLLAIHAIVFAFILGFFSTISLLPKQPAFQHLVVHQTIQSYAVLNLLVVVLFWLGTNRVLKTGDLQEASSELDLWLGGGVGVIALWLSWRLLMKPLWKYIAKHYAPKIAFGVTAIVLFTSSWTNSYVVFNFGDLVINKSAVCKQLYETKKQRGDIEPSVDEHCFVGHCINLMLSEP